MQDQLVGALGGSLRCKNALVSPTRSLPLHPLQVQVGGAHSQGAAAC